MDLASSHADLDAPWGARLPALPARVVRVLRDEELFTLRDVLLAIADGRLLRRRRNFSLRSRDRLYRALHTIGQGAAARPLFDRVALARAPALHVAPVPPLCREVAAAGLSQRPLSGTLVLPARAMRLLRRRGITTLGALARWLEQPGLPGLELGRRWVMKARADLALIAGQGLEVYRASHRPNLPAPRPEQGGGLRCSRERIVTRLRQAGGPQHLALLAADLGRAQRTVRAVLDGCRTVYHCGPNTYVHAEHVALDRRQIRKIQAHCLRQLEAAPPQGVQAARLLEGLRLARLAPEPLNAFILKSLLLLHQEVVLVGRLRLRLRG